jgi:hypothetical protein
MGVVAAALSMVTACGGSTPTAPNGSSPGSGLALTCSAPTILAGDLLICRATAAAADVSTAAIWTSSDPNVVMSQGISGLFVAKSEGQATVSATYAGVTVSTVVTVHLEDVLRVTATSFQGSFKVGTTATFWLQGFYGVASADSGTLTLIVTDQRGMAVSGSGLTVPHGADRYLLSSTFTLAPGTTRVCQTGILQIGSTTLTVVPDASLVPCVDVTP